MIGSKRFAVIMCILAVLMACAGISDDDLPHRPPSTVVFDGADAVLYVEVVDTASEQRKGLMGVDNLPANQGMAFVYGEPVKSTFWMKDTVLPLSIAFVDEAGHVIDVRDMQPCPADPCPTYRPDEPFALAIEANLGWFDEHGVEVGDRAELRVMAYG